MRKRVLVVVSVLLPVVSMILLVISMFWIATSYAQDTEVEMDMDLMQTSGTISSTNIARSNFWPFHIDP